MEELTSAPLVMEKLGGIAGVAELTGNKYSTASNWKYLGSFPAETFVVMTEALKAKGHTAPASLWRMVEVAS